jgi:hypothetical protein
MLKEISVVSSIWIGNCDFRQICPWDEPRTNRLLADSCRNRPSRSISCRGGFPDAASISDAECLRSFCGDGFCPADLPGESAGNRDVPVCASCSRLPNGLSRSSHADQSGLRQRSSRLARFLRDYQRPDATGAKTLRGYAAGTRTGGGLVCVGCHGDRAEHGFVPVGSLEENVGFREAQRAARFAWGHSSFRQSARGETGTRSLRWTNSQCNPGATT